jgi:hypothetical protein
LLVICAGLIYLVWQKKNILEHPDCFKIYNIYLGTAMLLFASLLLLAPVFPSLEMIKNTNFKRILFDSTYNTQKIDLNIIGGKDALNFVETQMPPKSIILADGYANDVLPLLTDNYTAAYPRSTKEDLSRKVYLGISEAERIDIINKLHVEYIFFSPDIIRETHLIQDSTQYQLIYDGSSKIFRVLKKAP